MAEISILPESIEIKKRISSVLLENSWEKYH
jgi:hypothetical protein